MEKTTFNAMSDIEIQIRKIKDIKMIHIYELTGAQIQNENTGCVAVADV